MPYPVAPDLHQETPFLVHPANQALLEGKTRRLRRRQPQCAWFISCFMVVWSVGWLGGGYALLTGYLDTQRAQGHIEQLETEGVATQGIILSQRTEIGDNEDRFYITYRFTLDDRPYGREQTVSERQQEALAPQTAVSIRYLPDDPQISSVVVHDALPYPEQMTPWWVVIVFNLIGLVVLLMLIYAIVTFLRNRWALYRGGQLLLGYALEAVQERDSDGDLMQSVKLTYHFQNPQGVWVKGSASYALKADWDNYPLLGTPLAILYATDNGHWVL